MGSPSELGHRERKKQQTREAIVKAALELFTERGFAGTTIADIAEQANIAPRTFFAYFPSKEDVLFWDSEDSRAAMRARILDRGDDETTFDALRAFLVDMLASVDHEDEAELCRRRLIRENDTLADRERTEIARFEDILTESIERDLPGAQPGDPRARMMAAAAAASLMSLGSQFKEDGAEKPEDPMAVLDEALVFLRGGLAAMQRS